MDIAKNSGKSKARLHWYKRCPADWRSGTRACGMSMELRGFYSECLDAMWEVQGPLPKDAKALSMLLGSNPRQVRALMAKLLALGKMVETEVGYHNQRMLSEIIQDQTEAQSSATGARVEVESRSKIPKNPINSTRDLEQSRADKEQIDGQGDEIPAHAGPVVCPSGPLFAKVKLAFNGSTERMLIDIRNWQGVYGTKAKATEWLAEALDDFGADALLSAYRMVSRDLAKGEKIRDPLAKLSRTAQTCSSNAQKAVVADAELTAVQRLAKLNRRW